MKTIFILILFSFNLSAQTYVKVADKQEYEKYLQYCNTPIEREYQLITKVTALKVNGQYTDSTGSWVSIKKPSIVLVPYGTKSVTFSDKQQMVIAKITIPVQRRMPSVPDFYKYWKTNFIQAGLLDERSGIMP